MNNTITNAFLKKQSSISVRKSPGLKHYFLADLYWEPLILSQSPVGLWSTWGHRKPKEPPRCLEDKKQISKKMKICSSMPKISTRLINRLQIFCRKRVTLQHLQQEDHRVHLIKNKKVLLWKQHWKIWTELNGGTTSSQLTLMSTRILVVESKRLKKENPEIIKLMVIFLFLRLRELILYFRP